MAGVKPLLETIGALLPKGIKAWHASPHDFNKFDMSKIGTGQGAQSYGHGVYAAESPAVSGVGGEYWKEFARHPAISKTSRDAADFLSLHNFDRQKAAQQTRAQLERNTEFAKGVRSPEELESLARERAEFEKVVKLLESDAQVGPRVYELNIKAEPDAFLQWDKPLKEQPNVTAALPRLLGAAKDEAYGRALASTNKQRADQLWGMVKNPEQATGEFAYRELAVNPEKTATMMRDAGIPGIRYLDQKSRRVPNEIEIIRKSVARLEREGLADSPQYKNLVGHLRTLEAMPLTHNYVLNNPDIIDIMRKLAIPGMVGGGAATAYQPQGQQ